MLWHRPATVWHRPAAVCRRASILSSLTLCALALAGCNDDTGLGGSRGREIEFTATCAQDDSTWAATRARDGADEPETHVYDISQGADTALIVATTSSVWPEDNPDGGTDTTSTARAETSTTRAATGTTRATMQSSVPTSFDAWAWYSDEADTDMFFKKVPFSPGSAGAYRPTDGSMTYYWPTSGRQLDFLAIANPTPSTTVQTNNPAAGVYLRWVQVEVPTANADQKDMLVAIARSRSTTGGTAAAVPLTFRHALTAVKFTADGVKGTVTSIKMSNIHCHAILNTYSGGVELYTNSDPGNDPTRNTFTWTGSQTVAGGSNDAVTPTAGTFFMAPQTLRSDAKIEVTVSNFNGVSGDTRTFTLPLRGQKWEVGKVVTYRLIFSWEENIFKITTGGSSISTNYQGQNGNSFNVQSYRVNWRGTTPTYTAIPFTATSGPTTTVTNAVTGAQSTVSGAAWVTTDVGTSFTGTQPYNTTKIHVAAQNATEVFTTIPASGSPNLSSAATLTGPVNLGTFDPYNTPPSATTASTIAGETANCYIVNHPGTYHIPLIYGNAITAGGSNPVSYKPFPQNYTDASVPYDNFVNYLGDYITSRSIPADINGRFDNTSGMSAELLWQDMHEGAITVNPAITSEDCETGTYSHRCIEFTLPAAGIVPGNAVIALKKDGDIVWSWHIWVSDAPSTQHLRTTIGVENDVLDRPLGFAGPRGNRFDGRSTSVTLTQTYAGETKTIVIPVTQSKYTLTSSNSRRCQYEWGRKDPYCPKEGGYNRTVWWGPSHLGWGTITSSAYDRKDLIRNPTKIIYAQRPRDPTHYQRNGEYPTARQYLNLWNATLNEYYGYAGDHVVFSDKGVDVWLGGPGIHSGLPLTSVKSVYDPSPPGFKVPTENAISPLNSVKQTGYADEYVPSGIVKDYYSLAYSNGDSGDTWRLYGNSLYTADLRCVCRYEFNPYVLCMPATVSDGVDGNYNVYSGGIYSSYSSACYVEDIIPVKD